MKRQITPTTTWVGYLDWENRFFHGHDYITRHGTTENAYLIQEEKIILIDTVKEAASSLFLENLRQEVDLQKISFIVINHGESDHTGALPLLMKEIPHCPIYTTAAGIQSLEGKYGKNGWLFKVVKNGDTVDIGNGKKLLFYEMKMIHWPDSMATFLTGDNLLFSNDAFGQHYATEDRFDDQVNNEILFHEAQQYFVNILWPMAPLITKKLTELQTLPIEIIAPSHGIIWRHPLKIITQYTKWLSMKDNSSIVILYDSLYNGTTSIANLLAEQLRLQCPERKIQLFSLSDCDLNEIMVALWEAKGFLIGTPTINNNPLSSFFRWLALCKALKITGKYGATFGCYGWSGEAPKIMDQALQNAGFITNGLQLKINWHPNKKEDYQKITLFINQFLQNIS